MFQIHTTYLTSHSSHKHCLLPSIGYFWSVTNRHSLSILSTLPLLLLLLLFRRYLHSPTHFHSKITELIYFLYSPSQRGTQSFLNLSLVSSLSATWTLIVLYPTYLSQSWTSKMTPFIALYTHCIEFTPTPLVKPCPVAHQFAHAKLVHRPISFGLAPSQPKWLINVGSIVQKRLIVLLLTLQNKLVFCI